ncbi:MAG: cytochrome C [Rhizobiales bacterium NRL2]|jgi:mono/diheme cytochrome c family protein|nr:MAG: cytochrome C [Rhizobiales bacterium NRL2]
MRLVSLAFAAAVIAATLAGIWWLGQSPDSGGGAQVAVDVPDLSAEAEAGAAVFKRSCVVCHGANAAGGPGGPPLVHRIYEPSHHGDGAFVRAVRQGVRQHHWNFGDMAPVPGVSDQELAQIIAYVRELQRANGIE